MVEQREKSAGSGTGASVATPGAAAEAVAGAVAGVVDSATAGAATGTVRETGIAVAVITVSDRSARGERVDASGPRASELLANAGYEVTGTVIPDGEASVEAGIRAALQAGARVVITSGGTGVGPRDRTPEGTAPILGRQLPGIPEELRRHGASNNRMAVLSRGIAGIAGEAPGALVVNLPGSVKAVEEGLEVLLPLLPHILHQLGGGDH